MSESSKNELPGGAVWISGEAIINPSDVVSRKTFAKIIGKTEDAVRAMIEKGKVPVIEMRDPANPSARAEHWVYLKAWNDGMKLAFESRPKEIRDGWLQWIMTA
ncbi:MAG: Cox family DNA-binding protein [Aeromonas hydrophila]